MSGPGPARAVLFDMDGVLVDTEPWWHEIRVAFAAEHGATWTLDDSRACMGTSSREWAAIMRDRLGVPLTSAEIQAVIVDRLVARYAAEPAPEVPGAPAHVRRIAAAVPVALASGAHPAIIGAALAAMGLTSAFGAVVAADEVARGKPAPDVYLEAARRLRVDPAACLVVEDSANGLRAGKAAGMRTVLIPSPGGAPDPNAVRWADFVLDSLAGLDPLRPGA